MTKKRVLSALLALCLLLTMFPLAAGAAEGEGADTPKDLYINYSDIWNIGTITKEYDGNTDIDQSTLDSLNISFYTQTYNPDTQKFDKEPVELSKDDYTIQGSFSYKNAYAPSFGESNSVNLIFTLSDEKAKEYLFEDRSHDKEGKSVRTWVAGRINCKVLPINIQVKDRKYDGTSKVAIESLVLDTTGAIEGETVTLGPDPASLTATLYVGDKESRDVGEYREISLSGAGGIGNWLSGKDKDNYTFEGLATSPNLTLTKPVKITPADRALTAALSATDLTPNKTAKVNVTADNAKKQTDFTENYTYSSNKDSVATVAADGTVTAKTKGEAIITVNAPATKNYAAGTQTVNVVVKGIPVTLTINATVKDVEVAPEPEPEPEPNPEPPEGSGGEGSGGEGGEEGGTGGEGGSTDGGDGGNGGTETPAETNADAPTTKKVVTLTVTANPADVLGKVTVTADNGLSVTKTVDKTNEWTANLPTGGDAKTYTFTASYTGDTTHESATATCQVKSDGTVVQPEKPPVTPPSSGTTTPPAPTPVEEVNKTPAVSGGTANATVSSSEGAGLVAEAQKPATREVSVKVAPTDEADTVNVTLPASTAAGIGAAKTDLLVETPLATVTLPSESLTDLGAGANRVTVSASRPAGSEALTITIAKDGKAVDSLPGNVKVTLPFAGAGKGTVVVLVNPDGTESVVKKSIARDEEMAMVLEGSASVKIKDNSKSFDDTQGHWADTDGSIDFVSSRELFKGTSDTSFSPEQTMTRGMIVTVLHRLENTPKGNAPAFGDVQSGDYYAEAVAWGAQNGIVTGTGNNNFAPGQDVSREQLATFLYRYANAYGVDTSSRSSLNGFGDSAKVSAYAKDAMEWCVGAGLIKGTGNNSLSPNGKSKRGEVAAILMRFVEYINK